MRSRRMIHIVEAHAEGEVGDVVVGGVAPPPGDTLWAQSRWIAEDDGRLRAFLLNEPRGGVFRHLNLLTPPKTPGCDMGFIVMEPCDTPPMSGSNSVCVATVLLETGILPMTEPETRLTLEAPGGPVGVRARCRDGRVEAVTLSALPSFVHRLDAALDVPGLGTIRADVAYGGDSFALVDAAALGFALEPGEARAIAELGARIAAAATERIGFAHPENPDWRHVSFCLFQGPLARGADGGLSARQAVAIRPGKIDRSPCGTGCAARMAAMAARGEMGPGDRFSATSLIGSRFDCAIAGAARVGDTPAIAPEITGRAWITGARQLMLDPHDPWPHGYRLGDTWPGAGAD